MNEEKLDSSWAGCQHDINLHSRLERAVENSVGSCPVLPGEMGVRHSNKRPAGTTRPEQGWAPLTVPFTKPLGFHQWRLPFRLPKSSATIEHHMMVVTTFHDDDDDDGDSTARWCGLMATSLHEKVPMRNYTSLTG
ncbi:hypothetical protein RUM43_013164 [Polyplax serrata]|uniref:Uncharacterized protein n=1 Tax=Polyplax serrata TaxID=468196 RepID=A0AAN8NWL9_POLSC